MKRTQNEIDREVVLKAKEDANTLTAAERAELVAIREKTV